MATRFVVTGDQYRGIDRKYREIQRQLDQKSGCPLDPKRVDRVFQHVVEGEFGLPEAGEFGIRLIEDMFTPTDYQLIRLRGWNLERKWGFSEDDFQRASRDVPAWPEGHLLAVVLVPYLDSVDKTSIELETLARRQQGGPRYDLEAQEMRQREHLMDGIRHDAHMLAWEVIDLGRHKGRIPREVTLPDSSPHAGVLACAALHPEWFRRINGKDIPRVWMPGYRPYKHSGDGYSKDYSPIIGFSAKKGEFELLCSSSSRAEPDAAVPVLLPSRPSAA